MPNLSMPVRLALVLAASVPLASGPSAAKSPALNKVCGLHSSVVLAPGETVGGFGAGTDSFSMTITGPAGSWIFYDGLKPTPEDGADSTEALRTAGMVAYRRNFEGRIYSVVPAAQKPVNGKYLFVMASGLDMMRQPLSDPALTGGDRDKAVLARIRPGDISRCTRRWYPGKGMLEQTGRS